MRQFHLDSGFTGTGTSGEDVENQVAPIEYLGIKTRFQIPDLGGTELFIENHQVSFPFPLELIQLLQLAAADVVTAVGSLPLLDDTADNLGFSRKNQLLQFRQ